jgi:hypothetical protein
MKALLAVLLASVSISAWADSWAMPNKAGGEIVITTRDCPRQKGLLRAYNYIPGGQMQEGCWTVLDERVHVVWFDGTKYTYPLDAFHVLSKDKKGTAL